MNPITYRLAAKRQSSIHNRQSSMKLALLGTVTAVAFSIGIAGIGAQQGSSKRGFSGAQAKEQMVYREGPGSSTSSTRPAFTRVMA
jgi:hypothetical protein